jgi:hypothetical protein
MFAHTYTTFDLLLINYALGDFKPALDDSIDDDSAVVDWEALLTEGN